MHKSLAQTCIINIEERVCHRPHLLSCHTHEKLKGCQCLALGGQTHPANEVIKEASCDTGKRIMQRWRSCKSFLCVYVFMRILKILQSVEGDYTKQPGGLCTSVRWLFACKCQKDGPSHRAANFPLFSSLAIFMTCHKYEARKYIHLLLRRRRVCRIISPKHAGLHPQDFYSVHKQVSTFRLLPHNIIYVYCMTHELQFQFPSVSVSVLCYVTT